MVSRLNRKFKKGHRQKTKEEKEDQTRKITQFFYSSPTLCLEERIFMYLANKTEGKANLFCEKTGAQMKHVDTCIRDFSN